MDSLWNEIPGLVTGAFRFGFVLLLPLLGGILVGALAAGFLKAVTNIEDGVIGFVGRLLGLVAALVIFGQSTLGNAVAYAARIWGGADYYF